MSRILAGTKCRKSATIVILNEKYFSKEAKKFNFLWISIEITHNINKSQLV